MSETPLLLRSGYGPHVHIKQLALLTVPLTADTFSTAGPEMVTQAVCAQRFTYVSEARRIVQITHSMPSVFLEFMASADAMLCVNKYTAHVNQREEKPMINQMAATTTVNAH